MRKLIQWLAKHLDSKAGRDDGRKVGIALVIAGLLGGFVQSDKVSLLDSCLLFSAGSVIWLVSVSSRKEEEEEADDGS